SVIHSCTAYTRRYLAETAVLPGTHPVPFFGGLTIELAAQSAILLGEGVVPGAAAWLPRYVDRARAAGRTATYQVRLRGGPSFQVRFDRGTTTVGPSQPRAADRPLH